jgi:hypothetical protein
MLQGILTQCCFFQLSTVAREVSESLKIDFRTFTQHNLNKDISLTNLPDTNDSRCPSHRARVKDSLLLGRRFTLEGGSGQPAMEAACRRRYRVG